jgi:ABC-2 type transport system ATP-binding protein
VIEARNVTFEYPGVRALDDVSFSLPPCSITALVGPNGAGKTTLLRCLAALEEPLSGEIRVDGIDVRRNPRLCHARVGYLSDFFGLYDTLPSRRCLDYAAASHRIPGPERPAAVARAAERLGITAHLDKRAGELSRGLRQRLAIAQAIVHEPRILLLDEPASGLDPDARIALSELFLELGAQGMTLLVSSHILAELDAYCSQIMIVREGRLIEDRAIGMVADDAPRRLQLSVVEAVPDLASRLADSPGVDDVQVDGKEATFSFAGDARAQHELLRAWIEAGLPIASLEEERTNLQDVYRERVRTAGGSR